MISAEHKDTWDVFEGLTGRPWSLCFTGAPTALILRFKYASTQKMAKVYIYRKKSFSHIYLIIKARNKISLFRLNLLSINISRLYQMTKPMYQMGLLLALFQHLAQVVPCCVREMGPPELVSSLSVTSYFLAMLSGKSNTNTLGFIQ